MAEAIVGRKSELDEVEAFLDRVPVGATGLVIAGAAGIGKSVIWGTAVGRAADRGWEVLEARPAEAEASFSFSGLGDLLEGVAHGALALPPPQRRALEVALLARSDDGEPLDQRTVAVAVLGILRQLAQEGPVLVAVDDMQWLDKPSAGALRFAARRLGPAAVGMAVALRTEAGLTDPIDLTAALPAGATRVVTLAPMSVAALHELVLRRLGLRLAHRTVTRLHEAADGNPFFALELVRALGAEPLAAGQPWPVSEDVRALLRRRLAGLTTTGRDALLVVAASSQPSANLIEAVLGGNGEPALAELRAADLIAGDGDRLRPSHPLVASVCYLDAPAERRREVHRRLTGAVDDPEQRARHLALAALGTDLRAAEALEQAATSAAARGAPSAAAELSEQARMLTPSEDGAERLRRLVMAAEFHFQANDPSRAEALLTEAAAALSPSPRRAEVLALLGDVLTMAQDQAAAVAVFERALADVHDDVQLAGELHSRLAWTVIQRGDLSAAESHVKFLRAHADRLNNRLLARALAADATIDLFLGRGLSDDQLTRILSLEGPDATGPVHLRASWSVAVLYTLAGRFAEALPIFEQQWDRSIELGYDEALPHVVIWAVWINCVLGDMAAAERYAAAATQSAQLSGGDNPVAVATAAMCFVQAFRGDVDAIRRDAPKASALLHRTDQPFAAAMPVSMLGFVELSRGDAAAAHEILGPLRQFVPPAGTGDPGVFLFVADEVEALIGVGELDDASSLLAWFEERGRTLERPAVLAAAARGAALLAAARAQLGEALEAVESALTIHEQLHRPLDLGRTLLVKGQIHRRRKEKRAAKESLQQALRIFDEVAAALWAERARAELARLGLRPAAPTELTPTEAQVAELAATGLTNKEVGERVFLTAKSVEGVLARVYRKLGIHSRAELGAAMTNPTPLSE